LDTRQLRNFLKIAEIGSITRAADLLGVAQPSLSQQILRLEDEIGGKLFQRSARGVTTTAAGDILQKHARQMLALAELAAEEIRRLNMEARAQVRLAMPSSISRSFAVPLAEAALEQEPSVSLRLQEGFSGAIRAMLQDGAADLGLLYDVESLDQLSVRRLMREEAYLIGPAGRLPEAGADGAVTLEAVRMLPLILPGPGNGLRKLVDQEAQRLGLRLKVASEIDCLEHVVGMVAEGHGYSVLPHSAIAGEVRAGKVEAVRMAGAFGGALFLARRAGAPVTEASRRIEALLVRLLEGRIEKERWLAASDAEPG
jgi:LysR family nitrogen assimilation transcriptional regulator